MSLSLLAILSLHRRRFLRVGTIWLAFAMVGCSESDMQRYPVEGQVTLDGRPVKDATIVFTPQGTGLAAAAKIEDGKFSLSAVEGPTKGTFSVRVNPLQAEMEEVDPADLVAANRRPSIPKIYQQDGRLTADINGETHEPLVFELSDNPK